MIPLGNFTLGGRSRKSIRQSRTRSLRAGYRVVLLAPPHDDALLEQIAEVSDTWLGRRRLPEIRLGIGWFERDWVRTMPVTAILNGSGRMVAFATRVEYPERGEAGFDLLRHDGESPGAIDTLVTEQLLTWREDGSQAAASRPAPVRFGAERCFGLRRHSFATRRV